MGTVDQSRGDSTIYASTHLKLSKNLFYQHTGRYNADVSRQYIAIALQE
jgi:hypothetical protein